ncbi:hypothetical protein CDL15_Pgr008056 [Punica granatum]|uniref:Uncharacterized protein n=1 Tax=Punica granatum TaxID=22663 RepID=A0A218VSS7_PUNGR|nr:hypothetical protein CDL15_Pgr008056 [Punica granatum]
MMATKGSWSSSENITAALGFYSRETVNNSVNQMKKYCGPMRNFIYDFAKLLTAI